MDPSSWRVLIWYEDTTAAVLQYGEGRMMIDSVVWVQYIKRDRHTDSHVAIANAANHTPGCRTDSCR